MRLPSADTAHISLRRNSRIWNATSYGYPGQHEPIIERRIWDAVQVKLDSNAKNQGWEGKPVPPLKGKLFDEYAHPLRHYRHQAR